MTLSAGETLTIDHMLSAFLVTSITSTNPVVLLLQQSNFNTSPTQSLDLCHCPLPNQSESIVTTMEWSAQ